MSSNSSLTKNDLACIQFNCGSINTGLGELKLLAYVVKLDIIALCETWLNEHNEQIPRFINYSSEWKHRSGKKVGCIDKKWNAIYKIRSITILKSKVFNFLFMWYCRVFLKICNYLHIYKFNIVVKTSNIDSMFAIESVAY